jgi:LysR family glycine cleavage system transcriptional activator
LLAHTLCYVDCKVDGLTWPNWAMWMAAAGVQDFDDRRCMAFTESSHVVQAVIEGGTIGLVELPMVARELAQGRLLRLFDVSIGMAPGYAYHLVYPDTRGKDPRVLAFRRWMFGELGLHDDGPQG